jgi:hypothetical protein
MKPAAILFDYAQRPNCYNVAGLIWHQVGNIIKVSSVEYVCDSVTESNARFRESGNKANVVYLSAQTEPQNVLHRLSADELTKFLTRESITKTAKKLSEMNRDEYMEFLTNEGFSLAEIIEKTNKKYK